MYLALRKCKINLVLYFCPLKPEIIRFSIGSRVYILGKKAHKKILEIIKSFFSSWPLFQIALFVWSFLFLKNIGKCKYSLS